MSEDEQPANKIDIAPTPGSKALRDAAILATAAGTVHLGFEKTIIRDAQIREEDMIHRAFNAAPSGYIIRTMASAGTYWVGHRESTAERRARKAARRLRRHLFMAKGKHGRARPRGKRNTPKGG